LQLSLVRAGALDHLQERTRPGLVIGIKHNDVMHRRHAQIAPIKPQQHVAVGLQHEQPEADVGIPRAEVGMRGPHVLPIERDFQALGGCGKQALGAVLCRAVAVFVEIVTIMRGQDGGVTGRNGRRERELALGLRLVMPGKPGSPDRPLCIRIKVRMIATFEPRKRIGVAAPVSDRVYHGVSAGGQ